MRVGNVRASNSSIEPTPLRPARSADHVESRSGPIGVTIPIPVTTTRRIFASPRLRLVLPAAHGLTHEDVELLVDGGQPRTTTAAACPSGVTLVLTKVGFPTGRGASRTKSNSHSGSG